MHRQKPSRRCSSSVCLYRTPLQLVRVWGLPVEGLHDQLEGDDVCLEDSTDGIAGVAVVAEISMGHGTCEVAVDFPEFEVCYLEVG